MHEMKTPSVTAAIVNFSESTSCTRAGVLWKLKTLVKNLLVLLVDLFYFLTEANSLISLSTKLSKKFFRDCDSQGSF